jgi:UDP-N-acetylglucosamine--N-acetylmuramyl-(pentapeptide) pyrophosphoryl-undecaprenol N-acetylglucosamine transferase
MNHEGGAPHEFGAPSTHGTAPAANRTAGSVGVRPVTILGAPLVPPLVTTRALRIALAGGGTGGHLVPGLNLLDFGVREQRVGAVHWFTTGRPVEERALAGLEQRLGVPATTSALGLESRSGAPSRLRQLVDLPRAVWRARRELRAFDADVLLGTGGFGSTPGILAARSLGIPVVLLEVNAVRGDAVRTLGRFAARVCHAMRGSLPEAVKAAMKSGAMADASTSAARHDVFTGPPDPPVVPRRRATLRLLVLGGSQGAGALNTFVARALPTFAAAGIEVVHQTGPNKRADAPADSALYRAFEYSDDVPAELAAATLVLCRGGASTLVEVAAARVPAIVVPYPHHKDRHQWLNAAELGAGALVVEESTFASEAGAAALAARLVELASPRGAHEREAMEAALAHALPSGGSRALFSVLDATARPR